MEKPKRRTLLFQCLGDVVVCFVVSVPLSVPAVFTTIGRPERGASAVFWASMLATTCGVAAVALSRLRRVPGTDAALIGLSTPPGKGSWKWLLLACAALPLLTLMQSTLLRILNILPKSADPVTIGLSQAKGWALCLALATLVLAVPISEELLFRGLLLGRFRAHGYLVSGTFVSAVIFMLVHDDPRQFLDVCGAGLLLAWLYHRTNSLWPPIALHALNNACYAIETILSVKW